MGAGIAPHPVRAAGGRRTLHVPLPSAREYLIAAVEDLEPGEWFDPVFLQALVDSSITITLAEGEQKTQDLTLGASR